MEQFTPKQERNGADGSAGEQNTAQPGPDITADIAALIVSSVADAAAWKAEGASVFHGAPGRPAGGNLWDWDSTLAVAEQPGEK